VLPDFLGPGQLKITELLVDGVVRYRESLDGPASGPLASGPLACGQVSLGPADLGRTITVTLHQADADHQATKPWAIRDGSPF
jgi:hypothetical protein